MAKQQTVVESNPCAHNAEPGAEHTVLDAFLGTWNAQVTLQMEPGLPPTVSQGVMTNSWALGGRFLEQRYKGEVFGCDFEGRGYFGFNNGSRKYEGVWMDTASTCIASEVGDYNKATKSFTMNSSFANPADGSQGTKRTIITIKSPDEHTMESYFPTPDGKEWKMMEIVYKRRK